MPYTDPVSSFINYQLLPPHSVLYSQVPTAHSQEMGREINVQKGGCETVLVSACFRCSPMGGYDSYLEFYKDSIGSAELGVGKP